MLWRPCGARSAPLYCMGMASTEGPSDVHTNQGQQPPSRPCFLLPLPPLKRHELQTKQLRQLLALTGILCCLPLSITSGWSIVA